MSDTEKKEVDDLFDDDLGLGSESEGEVSQNSETEKGDSSERNGVKSERDEEDDGIDHDTSESEEERELKLLNLSVPRHSKSTETEDDVYHMKVPVFINVDAHPFDPVDFKENIEMNAKNRDRTITDSKVHKNDLIREKLTNENTIRWKYSNVNDEIIKQSNCHFVEWDDGSLSLKIGNEMFDFKSLPLYDNLLVKSHDELEVLQAESILTKVANLLPTSTGTSTHRQLTNAIKNLQQKDKILNTITDSDPLEIQRMADENERKVLKMKRQLELKRRLQEERLGRASPALGGGKDEYDDEPSYERFNKQYNDEYDDEDDFIDNDDDEEIELDEDEDDLDRAAEKLRNVKEAGASKYRKDDADENEDEEEDSEEEARKKRRRIIDSDDEE